ncbi:MAG: hypothetical protein WBA38_00930 [Gordonia sp. (in: high G+C Gram-positive bacteria)]|uniref:hypothetical protein n=1 Tax=Gordonia sp. (in: high G+C Gram-positive bacteria) TaxID=84139 RepID=UPI003C731E8A
MLGLPCLCAITGARWATPQQRGRRHPDGSTCDEVVVETEYQWLTYRLLPVDVEPGARATALQE